MMWPARILGMCSGIAILVLLYLERSATGATHELYSTVHGILYLVLLGCIVAIVVTARRKPQS